MRTGGLFYPIKVINKWIWFNKQDIFLKHAIELHNFQTTGWKLVKWGNSIAKNKIHRDKKKSRKQIMYTQEKLN